MAALHERRLDELTVQAKSGEAAALRAHAMTLAAALERAHARETELAAQIRMVLEERFFRPVITQPGAGDEPRRPEAPAPVFAAEEMNDVTRFDPQAELAALQREEQEWRAQREARGRTAAPSGAEETA